MKWLFQSPTSPGREKERPPTQDNTADTLPSSSYHISSVNNTSYIIRQTFPHEGGDGLVEHGHGDEGVVNHGVLLHRLEGRQLHDAADDIIREGLA